MVTLMITPSITTHEPPSTHGGIMLGLLSPALFELGPSTLTFDRSSSMRVWLQIEDNLSPRLGIPGFSIGV